MSGTRKGASRRHGQWGMLVALLTLGLYTLPAYATGEAEPAAISCQEILSRPIMQQIVRVESSGNPFAIGVVGNQLVRQPRNLEEAVATVKALQAQGYNFSIGQGQVNKVHFSRLGWDADITKGFDVCTNMTAAAGIYQDCHERAVRSGYPSASSSVSFSGSSSGYSSTHAALSCYYSGDFERGARLGYVSKVLGEKAVAPSGSSRTTQVRSLSMMVE